MSSSARVPADVQEFLEDYPRHVDNPKLTKNMQFFAGERKAQPNDLFFDELLEYLAEDLSRVENDHGFVQWLFPIPEQGLNHQAQPLQKFEAEAIKSSEISQQRFLNAYKLMLHFFGLRLDDEISGIVSRDEDDDFARRQLRNLRSRGHNWLRISRILKALEQLGRRKLVLGFILHLYHEIYVTGLVT